MNIKLEETCPICGLNIFTFDETLENKKQMALRCAYCGHFYKWANKTEKAYYRVQRIKEKDETNKFNSTQYFALIKIKYHAPIQKIETSKNGDWVDLRAAKTVTLKKGESCIIPLGISVQLPTNYEAHIVPRSSTFKKWHIIQTNGVGIIDNSYSGDNDIWGMPVLATEDTVIHFNDRICQFRIVKRQPNILFEEVEHLGNADRGGFGSTGAN